MENLNQFQKILWAIDIHNDKEILENGIKRLDYLAKSLKLKVEPVFVSQGVMYDKKNIQLFTDKYYSILKKSKSSRFLNLKILILKNAYPTSTQQHVKAFMEYSMSGNNILVTQTRIKKGLELIFNGSFSETLVSESHSPVFVFHDHDKLFSKPFRIFVPLSLKENSKTLLPDLISLAHMYSAQIILFHSLKGEPLIESHGSEENSYYDYVINKIYNPSSEALESYTSHLKAYDVDCMYLIDESNFPVSEAAILEAKKYNSDFIAIPLTESYSEKKEKTIKEIMRTSRMSLFAWKPGCLSGDSFKRTPMNMTAYIDPFAQADILH